MNTELLDCGHARSNEHTYNGRPAWEFVLDFDGVRKICHACADARILDCGHTPSPHPVCTTGYGATADGKRHCYACCADQERAAMIATGRATLYLTRKDQPESLPGPAMGRGMVSRWTIGDWSGTLAFPAYGVKFSRNGGRFGSQRTDAYFTGPDGKEWHAVNRGDNDIARCRRIKGRK